jgi:hypothetical protein
MNSSPPQTATPAAEPTDQLARGRVTSSRHTSDLQARITALLRDLNI